VDILGKVRKIESRIASRIDSAAQGLVGETTRQPLEIVHFVLDAAERQIQPAGRGRHVFPFNRIGVSLLASSHESRARLEAVLEAEPSLRERVLERLRARHCEVTDCTVTLAFFGEARPEWTTPECHVEFARVASPDLAEQPGSSQTPRVEIAVTHGAADQPAYAFTIARIDLGRCAEVRDGRHRLIRTNHIAFAESGDPNETVSRRHAHIGYDPHSGTYRLHDDGSVHGTAVIRDGTTMVVSRGSRGLRVRSGDEIVLGQARLRITIDAADR
jgi:hypothetical protein